MLSAQTWLWSKKAVSNGGINSAVSVATDPTGNIFQVGFMGFQATAMTFGTFTVTKTGFVDAFLTKYDSNGNVLWAKGLGTSGGTYWTHLFSVVSDASGNAIVTGCFSGGPLVAGSTTLTNMQTNTDEFIIIKYDPNGNIVWANGTNGGDNDQGSSIDLDASGNSYVTGKYQSLKLYFNTDSLPNLNSGTPEVFIAKYGPSGNFIWARCGQGQSFDQGYGITVDPSGNCYTVGNYDSPTLSFGTTTLTNPSGTCLFLTKHDASGNLIWAKSIPQSTASIASSIDSDASGNIYITGSFNNSTITFGSFTLFNNSSTGYNTFIVKYDPSGNVVWAKSIGSTGDEQGTSISVKGNDLFVCGKFLSPSLTVGTYSFTNLGPSCSPIFIAQYDLNGNVFYATTLTGGSAETADITIDESCSAYITGSYNCSPFVIGTSTLTTTIPREVFISKLGYSCQALNINEMANNIQKSVIPNPASETLMILSEKASEFSLTNSQGVVILKQTNLYSQTVDVSAIPDGIYFSKTISDDKIFFDKIIIRH